MNDIHTWIHHIWSHPLAHNDQLSDHSYACKYVVIEKQRTKYTVGGIDVVVGERGSEGEERREVLRRMERSIMKRSDN